MTISGHVTIIRDVETTYIDDKTLAKTLSPVQCEMVTVKLVGIAMFTLEGGNYCAGWEVELSTYKDRADTPDNLRKVREYQPSSAGGMSRNRSNLRFLDPLINFH